MTDDDGKDITPNELAAKLPGVSAGSIRYYVSTKGAKTVADVKKIIHDIKIYGKNYCVERKLYKTRYGLLSLRRMWERHDHKDEVSINALSTRIHTHGAMSDAIWEGLQDSSHTLKNPRKICKCCGRKLLATWFEKLDSAPGGRHYKCNGCRRIDGEKKPRKVRAGITVTRVNSGDYVISEGKKYRVHECNTSGEGKGLVSGFRVMSNGDVMRRTTVFLGTDWIKIQSEIEGMKITNANQGMSSESNAYDESVPRESVRA